MNNSHSRTGLLLINLGTPDEPTPEKVGSYLKEFLMDPLVIDIPFAFRWILVNLLIVPRRSHASAKLYEKVWDAKLGSPLLSYTRDFARKMKEAAGEDAVVTFGMRYGKPSIESAVRELLDAGVTQITAFPLYPQYSLAATESSNVEVKRVLEKLSSSVPVKMLPAFYQDSAYLDAVAEVSRPYLERPHDFTLFSFHGLPERQVKKTDPSGAHCLAMEECCAKTVPANSDCYRQQCFVTAHEVARRLGIEEKKYAIAFQSRLGRTPWIRPYSDHFYESLPKEGIRKVAVLCPSFVADCLETLEEVQIRGREQFVAAGGEDLFLVPSLNAEDVWVKAALQIARPSFSPRN
jgi:ferrochelatase